VSDAKTPTGTIYDLGYKRYVGTRRPASTRWLVIMREQISNGWKKWWRYKAALGLTVITLCIAAGLLYFSTNKIIRNFGGANEVALTFANGILPLSFEQFCRAAFVLSLTLGATIIANDNQSGAFTFYYVRSIRPRDYVLGKLAGYGTLVATVVLGGPLLLAFFRLGLSDTTDQLLDNLVIVPKILAIGTLATLAYTATPLAISAMVPNRRYALALWAAYYLIVGGIATAMGMASGSAAGGLDIQTALRAVTFELFDLSILRGKSLGIDGKTGAIMLLVQCAVAISIIWYQVSRDQRHGVGGSS
jgi:hypothetical protein